MFSAQEKKFPSRARRRQGKGWENLHFSSFFASGERSNFNHFRRSALQRGFSYPYGAIHLLYVAKIPRLSLGPKERAPADPAVDAGPAALSGAPSDRHHWGGEIYCAAVSSFAAYSCGVLLAGKGGTGPPFKPLDGLSDTRLSAAASPHGCRSGWTRCPRGPASPEWTAGPRRFPAGGRQRSGAACGA